MLHRIQRAAVILAGATMLAMLAAAFLLHIPKPQSVFPSDAVPCEDGWQNEDGSPAAVSGIELPKGSAVRFLRAVDGDALAGRDLCFHSYNIAFKIYLNDRLVYDFDPVSGGYYGEYYGNYIHTVSLPAFSGDAVLRIDGTIQIGGSWTGFGGMVFQSGADFLRALEERSAPSFLMCCFVFLFGALLTLFALFEFVQHENMLETLSLGVLVMLFSFWCASPTRILILFTGNSSALRIIDYVVLCLLPVPALLFVAAFTKETRNPMVCACVGVSLASFAVQMIGTPLGLLDYADLLPLTHVMVVASIALIAYMIVKAIVLRRLSRSQRLYIISSLMAIACAGALDLVRYYSGDSTDAALVSRIGLVFFVIILTIYEMQQLVIVRMRIREGEVMKRLAMEDVLTGLQNRTAFVAYEEKLLKRASGKCVFVQCDLNHLKKVNDTYGHAEGDRHIIAAANVLRESFGPTAHCYRIGGDEFLIVLDGEDAAEDYARGEARLNKLQARYNGEERPPIPLAIAYGMAEYDISTHDPEAAERLADQRMYEHKARLKAEENQAIQA